MSPRVLESEWLDELPTGDVRAIRSRADLRRVNAAMGNARIIAAHLKTRLPREAPLRMADLGAGDGALALAVARRLERPRVQLTLVDRAPVVHATTLAHFHALGWRAAIAASDVFAFLSRSGERFDAVFVNLFLHHFDDERLQHLLGLIASRTRVLVACEPRRSPVALAGSRLLWALGCNDVTRHDALVSVRAGFSSHELTSLWPRLDGWTTLERAVPLFSHVFVACAATRS